jgi:hypothetical protein
MTESNPNRDSRLSPRVERTSLAYHYVESDVPHVLARVRLMHTFLDALDDREDVPDETSAALYRLYSRMMNDSLAPYALVLAESLIALEDSLEKPASEPEAEDE